MVVDSFCALGRLAAPAVVLTAIGCASTPAVKSVPNSDLMAFLDGSVVTRQDTYVHLGQPNASFEQDRVLAYRITRTEGGYYVHPTTKGWQGVNYDLVLVFDADGVLRRHSLVGIRASSDAR